VTEKVIQENPNNYYSLNEVWNLAVMEKYSYDNLSRVFGYLSDSLKQTNLGQLVASQLAVLKKTSAGQEFPEYSQPDMDGNIVKVSDYRGKYLLLTFTSVGIEKEKQATGIKQTLYAKYHDAGLELMDVMFEDAKAKEKVKEYISGNHLAWKVVSDFKGWNNFAMRAFSIENIPCIFLINPDGVIIASRIKLTDVAPTIEGAFNK
jgi:peroxiredoxin